MKKSYVRIWTSSPYRAEIYDNCYARLSVRSDGLRARTVVDGTKWDGNTGCFNVVTRYYDGRIAVKKLMKNLRLAQLWAIKIGEDKKSYIVIDKI